MRTPAHILLPCAVALALLSGCQLAPRLDTPEPTLELMQAAPLDIPAGCVASGSFVVSFSVATTGRATQIESPADAPECVQSALVAWVESFRYVPPARTTPTAVEWLMVSAKRGS